MQPLLIERIKTTVPGLAQVDSVFALADIERQSAASPACWVIYCGDEANDNPRQKSVVTQYWAVVLTTQYPDTKQTGDLLGKLINALSDWQPHESSCQPLTRAKERLPVQFENDFLCFPLLFSARFIWPRKAKWTP